MKIPYGMSNFAQVRREGYFYADKTPFLPHLESGDAGHRNLLFLRPRRMGKSLLLSMLEYYYDLGWASDFDTLFGGLWIHDHPTPERNSYLVLRLDFSVVSVDGGAETLRRTFVEAVRGPVLELVLRHGSRVPALGRLEERLYGFQDAESLLSGLFGIVKGTGHKLYILIDEYDTFANSLLAGGGEDLYSNIVDLTGFVRTFYRTLKTGTASGAVGRVFITGVLPLLIDDLASGFNIVSHASRSPQLNTLAGFTRADVERIRTRRDWATEMLDPNVRIDYGRLQRLGLLSGAAAEGRREVLTTVLQEGETRGKLVEQFGAKSVSTREQFVSLLYYMGMLTLSAEQDDPTMFRLEIPNRVIRELSWSHMAYLIEDQEELGLDTQDLDLALRVMAGISRLSWRSFTPAWSRPSASRTSAT